MELDPLSKAVRDCDEVKFEELWDGGEEAGQRALLAGVLTGAKGIRDEEVFTGMLQRLMDVADPDWRSLQDEGLLWLAVRSAVPGVGSAVTREAGLQTGDDVVAKLPTTLRTMGPVWMYGVVVDGTEDSIRVHFPYSGLTSEIAANDTPSNAVRDRVADVQTLTPGMGILLRLDSSHAAELIELANCLSSSNFDHTSVASPKKVHLPTDETGGDLWVEATLTAFNSRGGYDVATKDGTVQYNCSSDDIRVLGRRSTLGYEPIPRSLITAGQHVRVIEKGTGDSWKGILKGRNPAGGYEVLYPADGDYEIDVPVAELFVPVDPPEGEGGGVCIVESLLKRDCRVAGSQGLQIACKRNNLNIVRCIIDNAKRPYLGITLTTCSTGLRVVTVNPDGPSAGLLCPGDIIVAFNGKAATGSYHDYVEVGEPVTVSVARVSGAVTSVELTPTTNKVDHMEKYLRRTGLDLTRSEAVAKLLIEDGASLALCKVLSRGWYEAGALLLDLGTEQNLGGMHKGKHALETACFDAHIPMVTRLLQLGADPSSSSVVGHTPLYAACCAPTYSERLRLVALLLQYGASPRGTRAMPTVMATPPKRWSRTQSVLQNTPTGWGIARVLDGNKDTFVLMCDDGERKESSEELRLASWHPTCLVIYRGRPAVVQATSLDNQTIVLKQLTSNGPIEAPLWEVDDLPGGQVVLQICKLLCSEIGELDEGLGSTLLRMSLGGAGGVAPIQLPMYRPVELTERYKGSSAFELVGNEETALFLMQVAQAHQQTSVLCRVHPSYAAKNGWLRVLEVLKELANPAVDWDDVDYNGMPPVANALETARVDVLRFLIEVGANADGETYDGRHFTLLAVEQGADAVNDAVDYLKVLASSTRKILRRRDSGALGLASKLGLTEVVNFLLENGASIKDRYARHLSFEWACIDPSLSKESILLRLIEKRAEPNMAEVVASGYNTALGVMLQKHPSAVNHRARSTGNTPLMNACRTGNLEALSMLIGTSDLDASNDEGRTALFMACGAEDTALGTIIVKELIKAGAKVMASEAVAYAASLRNHACLRLLMNDESCNPNEKYNMRTALDHSEGDPLTCSILATNPELEVTLADIAMQGAPFFDSVEVALMHGDGLEVDDIDDDFGRTALAWVCMERYEPALRAQADVAALYLDPEGRGFTWLPCTATLETLEVVKVTGGSFCGTLPATSVMPQETVTTTFKGVSLLLSVEGGAKWVVARVTAVHDGEDAETTVDAKVTTTGEEHKGLPLSSVLALPNKTLVLADHLLQNGSDINTVDSVGKSVLHLSVEVGDEATTMWVLNSGGDVQSSGALLAAVQKGSLPLVELLLNHGGSLLRPWHGKYPAMLAKHQPIMQRITDALEGFTLEELPEEAVPSVADCTRYGWSDLVKRLVVQFPTLASKPSKAGVTAIEAACKRGEVAILQTLLSAGVSPADSNQLGETPLFTAARAGHKECVEMLLGEVSPVGTRSVPAAAACGHYEIVKILLEAVATTDAKEALASEVYNGKDALLSVVDEAEACAMVKLLKDNVTDTQLLYFATSGWYTAVSLVLKEADCRISVGGMWSVVDSLARMLLWSKMLPGVGKGEQSVASNLKTREKWHCTILEHTDDDTYLVETDDGKREEVYACELYHEVDPEEEIKSRAKYWAIIMGILRYCPTVGIDTAKVLTTIGSSDPMPNLVYGLRVCCKDGLGLYLEGVRESLFLAFDEAFASMQQKLRKRLCLPPDVPPMRAITEMSPDERLSLFMKLYQEGRGTFAESPLAQACRAKWVEAVEAILQTEPEAHTEPAACHIVAVEAEAAFQQGDSEVLQRLATIMSSLLHAGFPFEASDMLTIYKLKKLSDQPAVHLKALPASSLTERWAVRVLWNFVSLTHEGATMRQHKVELDLGLLHMASYHSSSECIDSLLRSSGDIKQAAEPDNKMAQMLPRDYATSMACHDMLLQAEQETGRIPEIEDIDLVIGVEMGDYEVDLSLWLSQWLLGKSGPSAEMRAQQLTKEKIKQAVEELGVGAFLWEPAGGEVFIICNASMMRLETEARRSLQVFSKENRHGVREFSSGARQYLVEHILNIRSGSLEVWRCTNCKDTVNDNAAEKCKTCHKPYDPTSITENWLDRLQANWSIRKTFGVHDATERDHVFKMWRWQPFSHILEYLREPNIHSDEMYECAKALNSYLGSKITFYFLFACFYMSWLLPLMVTGAFFTFFQVYHLEVDNSVSLVNGVFTILWASLCVKRWRRKSSEFAFIFRTRDYERLSAPSAEYLVRNEKLALRVHPVTGLEEPDFTWQDRLPRQLASWGATLFMIGVVATVMFANFAFRNYLDPDGEDTGMQIVAGIENALSVIILDAAYKHLVDMLCDWENHRTVEDRQQSLIGKWFGFQYVNGFSGLTLTMMTGSPGELLTQLASLLLTQAFVSLVKEKAMVFFVLKLRTRRAGLRQVDDEREAMMLADSQKPIGQTWLFEDYSMTCLQFTYVISFASVLPLAPFFAFVVSFIELHGDLYKYLYLGQRGSPEKASGIGIWLQVLDIVTICAIPYNTLVIFRQGEAWKRHTWLRELFTESTACQAVSGSLSLILILFFIKVVVTNFIDSTARWVRESELRTRFKSRKSVEPTSRRATLDTQIINVRSSTGQ